MCTKRLTTHKNTLLGTIEVYGLCTETAEDKDGAVGGASMHKAFMKSMASQEGF